VRFCVGKGEGGVDWVKLTPFCLRRALPLPPSPKRRREGSLCFGKGGGWVDWVKLNPFCPRRALPPLPSPKETGSRERLGLIVKLVLFGEGRTTLTTSAEASAVVY
jgi:hypothetical protein